MYFPAVRENTIQHDRADSIGRFSTTGPTRLDVSARQGRLDWTCFISLVNTMDIDIPPNPEISFQTVLDAVNRQSQEIEAKVDAQIS